MPAASFARLLCHRLQGFTFAVSAIIIAALIMDIATLSPLPSPCNASVSTSTSRVPQGLIIGPLLFGQNMSH
ncbi:unnamed protein product [Lampetra fluviatilis]